MAKRVGGEVNLCLESSEDGSIYMGLYDRLDPRVRYRLRNASVNICCACLVQQADDRPEQQLILIHEWEKEALAKT